MSRNKDDDVHKQLRSCPQTTAITSTNNCDHVHKQLRLCPQTSTMMSTNNCDQVLGHLRSCPETSVLRAHSCQCAEMQVYLKVDERDLQKLKGQQEELSGLKEVLSSVSSHTGGLLAGTCSFAFF
eukprot:1158537-Pelagomonas_calceolata.AAC.25